MCTVLGVAVFAGAFVPALPFFFALEAEAGFFAALALEDALGDVSEDAWVVFLSGVLIVGMLIFLLVK